MRRRTASRGIALLTLLAATAVVAAACSSSGSSSVDTTAAPSNGRATTGQTIPGDSATYQYLVFNGDGNNLDAYAPYPPLLHQRVNSAFGPDFPQTSNPKGRDINAQICFFPDGSNRFIAGEDTNQTKGVLQGWGIFQLSGDHLGNLSMTERGKVVPTYQSASDNAENYGCGFLKDGRVLTGDVGNQALGPADGQLIEWFPPFEGTNPGKTGDGHWKKVSFCKLDVDIATAQSIYVDENDNIYIASARPSSEAGAAAQGVYKYSPPFPTNDTAAGGCGKKDSTGAPMATTVHREKVLAAGEHGMYYPSGIARTPTGGFYVSSVATGVIDEYDKDWKFVRTILQPPAGETIGTQSYSTGTPLGLGVGPDGTIFFADIGIVKDDKGNIGPGEHTGSLRRITFTNGKPNPPETMITGLDYPDGIGIWLPSAGSGSTTTTAAAN